MISTHGDSSELLHPRRRKQGSFAGGTKDHRNFRQCPTLFVSQSRHTLVDVNLPAANPKEIGPPTKSLLVESSSTEPHDLPDLKRLDQAVNVAFQGEYRTARQQRECLETLLHDAAIAPTVGSA